jgi:hypothetical protein
VGGWGSLTRADQIPPGPRCLRTWGLGMRHLERCSREHPRGRRASLRPEVNPRCHHRAEGRRHPPRRWWHSVACRRHLVPSSASSIGSSGADISRGTITIRGELEETRARSPMLATDGATKGTYGGVTECAVGRWTIKVTKVRLLSPKHSPSTSEHEQEERERCKPTDSVTHILRGHRQE